MRCQWIGVSETWFNECMSRESHSLISSIHCIVYRGSPLSFCSPLIYKQVKQLKIRGVSVKKRTVCCLAWLD